MNQIVRQHIASVRALKDAHFRVGESLLSGLYQFKLDHLATAVLHRSLALVRGFCDLVESQNMIAAAPLMRCQLDNGLRFFAATLVNDPHKFAWQVRSGTPVRKIKDRNGKLMTDAYLVEQLSAEVPWVKTLYEQGSGYVHLSDTHIFLSVPPPDAEGSVTIAISGQDGDQWTDDMYLEAIEAFDSVTEMVIELVEGWAQLRLEKLKKLPPEVVEAMERMRTAVSQRPDLQT